jgi:membrane-associated protease RseP (regulator of RpoE activity)
MVGYEPVRPLPADRASVPAPAPPRRERRVKYAVLLALTFITTTLVGIGHYLSFAGNFGATQVAVRLPDVIFDGLWYSLPALAILGAHELGHYFACRYYRVDASLPYFLPAPLPLFGTFGAFIRIRQVIPTKRQLFDIGIAGPIAGFMVAVPVLLAGVAMSRLVPVPPDMQGYELGEPLIFRIVAWLRWGTLPEGYSINLHPMGFAAWFGLLATLLNLFPIGQLDGGHVAYAALGRKSTWLTVATALLLIGLTFVSWSWLLWTGLTTVLLLIFGVHHPRTIDEHEPLDTRRKLLTVFAVIMFILCFTPAPLEPLNIVTRP